MGAAYYNEVDPFCCEWLRELIAADLIAPGDVDERDIRLVQPEDLRGYIQCHFFAGVGVWSYALRLAGWPDAAPVWSGSCPCPPFSSAGKKKSCVACGDRNLVPCPRRTGYFICCACGHAWPADARHLWPEQWRLIAHGRPPVFFGEQVASNDGRTWLAAVRASLEILGYAARGTDLCAAGVGAPHIRQRLFFVGFAARPRGGSGCAESAGVGRALAGNASGANELADADSERLGETGRASEGCRPSRRGSSDELAHAERTAIRALGRGETRGAESEGSSETREQRLRAYACQRGRAGGVAESSSERFTRLRLQLQPGRSLLDQLEVAGRRPARRVAHTGYTERGQNALGRVDSVGEKSERPEGADRAGERLPPRRGGDSVAQGDGEQQGLEGLAGDVGDGHEPGRLREVASGSTSEADGASDGTVGQADGERGRCESGGHGPGTPPAEQPSENGIEGASSVGVAHGESGGRGELWDAPQPGRGRYPDGHGFTNGFWRDADWLPCRDGKARPVEPGAFPLAHGAPARVGRLRAYGNAINAEAAAAYLAAYLDMRGAA